MNKAVVVLVLESNATDAEASIHELRDAGFDPQWTRVDHEADYDAELTKMPDLILADYALGGLDSKHAMNLLRKHALDIPSSSSPGQWGRKPPSRPSKMAPQISFARII